MFGEFLVRHRPFNRARRGLNSTARRGRGVWMRRSTSSRSRSAAKGCFFLNERFKMGDTEPAEVWVLGKPTLIYVPTHHGFGSLGHGQCDAVWGMQCPINPLVLPAQPRQTRARSRFAKHGLAAVTPFLTRV